MTLEQKLAMANIDATVGEANARVRDSMDRATLEERTANELCLAKDGHATPKQLERCLRRRFPRLDVLVSQTPNAWYLFYGANCALRDFVKCEINVSLDDASRALMAVAYPNHTPLAAA